MAITNVLNPEVNENICNKKTLKLIGENISKNSNEGCKNSDLCSFILKKNVWAIFGLILII